MSFLKAGDTIAFIAPSCSQQGKDLSPAVSFFEEQGLIVKFAHNLNTEYRYMAGTDTERANALNSLFADPEIKALFCIRGGGGATRMLDGIDWTIVKKNPKPIIGLSDSTALQNAIYTKTGGISLTGFLPLYDFKNGKTIAPEVAVSLKTALFNETHRTVSGQCHTAGKANGVIIGGNLTVLLYLCGTQYFPDLEGKILLLEDIGNKTFQLDLMFNQLKQQKNFSKLAGIIFGNFNDCRIFDPEDGTVDDCINDFTKDLNIPIIKDFAYGHIPVRHILPIGLSVEMVSGSDECIIKW